MPKYMPGKLSNFFSAYKEIYYKKGETILRPEDKPQGIYYIKEGFVKLNTIFSDGKELTLNIFKKGTYFPMMWAIANLTNNYFSIAQTDVTVYRAPRKSVLLFLKRNPEVLYELTRRILIGMDGVFSNIEYILFGNSYKRVIGALFLCSKRFGDYEIKGKIKINLPLTHQDIANIAGICRETASIALKKLEKEKVISYKDRLIIIENPEALQNTLGVYKKVKRIPHVS